jgi:D-alanine-D-alanine ligase
MAAALSPFDDARFDFRYDPDAERLVYLEGNIVCSLGPATVVARAAKLGGIDYPSLIGHLVARSLRRQRMEL